MDPAAVQYSMKAESDTDVHMMKQCASVNMQRTLYSLRFNDKLSEGL
jgi:hypothetical protein